MDQDPVSLMAKPPPVPVQQAPRPPSPDSSQEETSGEFAHLQDSPHLAPASPEPEHVSIPPTPPAKDEKLGAQVRQRTEEYSRSSGNTSPRSSPSAMEVPDTRKSAKSIKDRIQFFERSKVVPDGPPPPKPTLNAPQQQSDSVAVPARNARKEATAYTYHLPRRRSSSASYISKSDYIDRIQSPQNASHRRQVSDSLTNGSTTSLSNNSTSDFGSKKSKLAASLHKPLPMVKIDSSPLSPRDTKYFAFGSSDVTDDETNHSEVSDYSYVGRFPSVMPSPSIASETYSDIDSELDPEQKAVLKRWKKKRHTIRELVETEESFVNDMLVISDCYIEQTNENCPLTKEEIDVIFDGVKDVIDTASRFSEALQSQADQALNEDVHDFTEDNSRIGKVFIDELDTLETAYSPYYYNHGASIKALQKAQTRPDVAQWLANCRLLAEHRTHAWDLASLLIKPVQRFLKYPLLLTQMRDCTPKHSQDYDELDRASKSIALVADSINDKKKTEGAIERVKSENRKRFAKSLQKKAHKMANSIF